MRTVELYCEPCGASRPFEQPPCGDDHGPECTGQECAELACVVCGHALLVGPVRVIRTSRVTHPKRVTHSAPEVRPAGPTPRRRAA
ncbi:MAG TPA: hypothetical protein VFB84_20890 [Micromonosporaceae bacterium]|nr:hypothetical protein [Micromonosporaceae bacterium]